MMTQPQPTALSMGAEISPVYAPSFSQKTSCAPIPTAVDRAAVTAAGRFTKGGHTTTSAWDEFATNGTNCLKNTVVSAAVLYIFQLPAKTGLRMILPRIQ